MYTLASTKEGENGVLAQYRGSGGLELPEVILGVSRWGGDARKDKKAPKGAKRIKVNGHRGFRLEEGGMSILSWRSGDWVFGLRTASDQGKGQFHVVDMYAHAISEFADAAAKETKNLLPKVVPIKD